MERVFRAVRKVVDAHLDVEVVYPVHLNPVVQEIAHKELGGHKPDSSNPAIRCH